MSGNPAAEEGGRSPLALLLPFAAIAVLLIVVLAAVVPAALADPTVELVGAGDITGCGSPNAVLTAGLIAQTGGRAFTLGDNAYPDGAAADFACFDESWGNYRDGMLPVIGNHEYATPDASGYFSYFGAAAAPPGAYYAVDVGDWRLYALNSECANVSCNVDSVQYRWLVADLASHPHECTLALWHEPRFSDGPHGDQLAMAPIWEALYASGAELVLNGHDHLYERFEPLGAQGAADPDHGITEIVAGTGGIGLVQFVRQSDTRVSGNDQSFGVLDVWLHADSFNWTFVPTNAGGFTDSGSAPCHDAPAVVPGASPASPVSPTPAPPAAPSAIGLPAGASPTPEDEDDDDD